jgi:hypothetical protein
MLDITFYGDAATEPRVIEFSTPFFECLAQSDFAEIGSAQSMVLSVEGDAPTKGEYLAASYGLRKLHKILTCVKDQSYLYLERV